METGRASLTETDFQQRSVAAIRLSDIKFAENSLSLNGPARTAHIQLYRVLTPALSRMQIDIKAINLLRRI